MIVNYPSRLPERYGGDVSKAVRAVSRFAVEWSDRTVEMKSDDSSIGVSLRVTIVTPAAGGGPPRPPGGVPPVAGAPPRLHAVRQMTRTRSGQCRYMRMCVDGWLD